VPASAERPAGLTVAVTGPTGDIGKSVVRALERREEVERIVGMARRPFDPAEHGWTRAAYRRGDVLDRASVEGLVADADVVVHLAFIIFGSHEETRRVNLAGTRNVFEAAVAAGAKRLVYTSSVAAYGFPERAGLLTEENEARGTDRLYYSAQKAELEAALADAVAGSETDPYLFRPCVVAGADSPAIVARLVDAIRLGGRLGPIERALGAIPGLRPILPDTGVPFQLVHHDDVADAVAAAVLGRGAPGAYNLAGPGELTSRDLARELGWRSVPVPKAAVEVTAEVLSRVPGLPAEVSWINAFRTPVLMDTSKARSELGWSPRHDALETLRDTVEGARQGGLL
jgi:nucleoside-diphosphate-sugar epimerase